MKTNYEISNLLTNIFFGERLVFWEIEMHFLQKNKGYFDNFYDIWFSFIMLYFKTSLTQTVISDEKRYSPCSVSL